MTDADIGHLTDVQDWYKEHTMSTGTSGISGLTGGNCTQAEHERYTRDFADVAGWDGTLAYPVRETWVTPGQTLAAELDVPFDRFCAVFMSAGKRLTDAEYAQMEAALAELGSMILCLRV